MPSSNLLLDKNIEQFLKDVIDRYHAARETFIPHHKISRGESRSIASETEDLLAYYLAITYPKIDHIYINQNLTPTDNDLKKQIGKTLVKPDLVICNNGIIKLLIDVKMDLGYIRNEINDLMYKTNFAIQTLKQKSFRAKVKKELDSEEVALTFDKDTQYIYFVVSDKNNKPANLKATKDLAKRLDNVEIYTALTDMHPNEYGIDILESKNKIQDHINYKDIQALDDIINASMS